MPKQVNGYLAGDGTFFEDEPECERYDCRRELEGLCETHGINFDNFIATLNAWHRPIRGYFDADDKCKEHQLGTKLKFDTLTQNSLDGSAFLSSEGDNPDDHLRDKDAKGFLEQQIRRNF